VGAVPRRKADRKAGKHFFFEKKKQKTFDYFGFGSPGEPEAEFANFFGSFFQKRTAFCCVPWPGSLTGCGKAAKFAELSLL
jgi:hypothetical protein